MLCAFWRSSRKVTWCELQNQHVVLVKQNEANLNIFKLLCFAKYRKEHTASQIYIRNQFKSFWRNNEFKAFMFVYMLVWCVNLQPPPLIYFCFHETKHLWCGFTIWFTNNFNPVPTSNLEIRCKKFSSQTIFICITTTAVTT